MKKFSIQQKNAIDAVYGQNLIVACPGSGKTTVIIERLKRMVEKGISPESMLNITFTKAAALEMENRFKRECHTNVTFSTIHSFCYKILSCEAGYNQGSILKESEKYVFIIQKLIELGIASGDLEELCKNIMQEISYIKNKEIPYTSYYPEFCEKKDFSIIYKGYESYKDSLGKIDFDDMLIYCRNMLRDNPNILAKYQKKYQFITVDEFQDVNHIQAEICYMLTGENGNLYIVGDDDQSIYKFRAADSSIMLSFKMRYPDANIMYLDINYRSGKEIVNRAGKLILYNENRYKKDFFAYKDEDGGVRTIKNIDSIKQTENIVAKIEERHIQGKDYSDMAILYRNNKLAVPFISAFIKKEIPFYTTEIPKDHHAFIYEDIMAYWRLSKGQSKKGDLQRVLNRPSRYLKGEIFKDVEPTLSSCLKACNNADNVDNAQIKIFEMMEDIKMLGKKKKPKTFIKYLVEEMGYKKWLISYAQYRGKNDEEDLQILDILENEASQFESMEEWTVFVKYYEEKLKEIKIKKDKTGICLSTFHSSKGLEWDTVYIVNVNDGITPFGKAETVEELEEERRMFYVAATRAKTFLYLSYIDNTKSKPSQYLYEMGFCTDNFLAGDKKKLDSKYGLGNKGYLTLQ